MSPRGVDPVAVGGASAVGAVLLAGCVLAAGDGPPYAWLHLALVPPAVAAAFVLDEPAAAAADAVPSSLRRRTAGRLAALSVPCGLWTAGVAAVAVRAPGTAVGALLVSAGGVLALTLAAAAVLRRAGVAEPGEAVAAGAGGLLLATLVFAPAAVPMPPEGTLAWAVAALAGALVVTLATGGGAWPRRPGSPPRVLARRRR
ncbi:hypothetical protein [Geodermatophilus nigrescens]|uniref:Uncharacterized protein n=1 Tax=Geodermatophilus nigrescens TaxID=1070870 RepID=A0A1M5R4G8_9ACTN|nr:hypothetical protein [Geodermatophilus nigrescens]SHH20663.1 hypothetical protein SAMN05444351_4286 [Geodermatophilus nigrescens]